VHVVFCPVCYPRLVMMLSIGSSDLDTALRAGDFCAAGGTNV